MSERTHAAAWKTLIDAKLGNPAADPNRGAFDYDEVPATLPAIYVLTAVERRFGGDTRNTGQRPMRGWRLTTVAVGRTVDEARFAREKVAELEETRASGIGSTLLVFESETPIAKDGDRYSGATTWTYATPA